MKRLSLFVATLAIPYHIAFAQLGLPPTAPTNTSIPSTGTPPPGPYIPLAGTSTTTSAGSGTWFIDVAGQRVVFCSQNGATTGTAATASGFTCTAEAIPTQVTGASPGATPSRAPTPAPGM